MPKLLAVWAVSSCLAFISQPAFADDCDAKCRAAVASAVDADVAKLDKGDQAVIARIKPILDAADASKLGELKGKLESGRRWRINDQKQRALWYEVVYVALNYASTPDCFSRGFWFMLYAGARAEDKEFAERYNRAQYYLAARHGNDAYKCTKQ